MFAENLSEFFDDADFALGAIYDGRAQPVNVIFDRAFIEAITGVAATNPVALVQTSALDANPKDRTLLIGTDLYTIRGFEPQDDGALLLLQLKLA